MKMFYDLEVYAVEKNLNGTLNVKLDMPVPARHSIGGDPGGKTETTLRGTRDNIECFPVGRKVRMHLELME